MFKESIAWSKAMIKAHDNVKQYTRLSPQIGLAINYSITETAQLANGIIPLVVGAVFFVIK